MLGLAPAGQERSSSLAQVVVLLKKEVRTAIDDLLLIFRTVTLQAAPCWGEVAGSAGDRSSTAFVGVLRCARGLQRVLRLFFIWSIEQQKMEASADFGIGFASYYRKSSVRDRLSTLLS